MKELISKEPIQGFKITFVAEDIKKIIKEHYKGDYRAFVKDENEHLAKVVKQIIDDEFQSKTTKIYQIYIIKAN